MCPLKPLPSSSTVVVKPVLRLRWDFKLLEKFNPLSPLKLEGSMYLNLLNGFENPSTAATRSLGQEPAAAPNLLPACSPQNHRITE